MGRMISVSCTCGIHVNHGRKDWFDETKDDFMNDILYAGVGRAHIPATYYFNRKENKIQNGKTKIKLPTLEYRNFDKIGGGQGREYNIECPNCGERLEVTERGSWD